LGIEFAPIASLSVAAFSCAAVYFDRKLAAIALGCLPFCTPRSSSIDFGGGCIFFLAATVLMEGMG
jgi:hypothetical protein